MSESQVIDIARSAIQVTLLVAAPMLIVSLVVGLMVSLFQVATSLQDVTLTFVPKIIAVGITMIFAASWILRILIHFTSQLFAGIPEFVG